METTVEVTETSQVASARRLVADRGAALGMSDADLGRAALAVTELATNLVKYARDGTVTVSDFTEGGVSGLQIVALDSGPGIADFEAAERDGHSTGGSLGIGLGVIRRSADVFDAYTGADQGSAFLVRILKGGSPPGPPAGALQVAARCTPKTGQVECGDAWGYAHAARFERVCVVDGLGHGPLAASASAQALAVFEAAAPGDSPVTLLQDAHAALKGSRGAVMAVACIDTEEGTIRFSGVGNIAAGMFFGDESHRFHSIDGIVGYNARGMRVQERPWAAGATLIMSSDGLSSRLGLRRRNGLLQRHPGLIAAVMYREYARGSDDATVVVARDSR